MNNEIEIIKTLVERINHLENVLFSSALGFLVTTTFAIFTAIYSIKSTPKVKVKSKYLIFGTCSLYILLSGYYYFILTHFYAAANILIPFKSQIDSKLSIDSLWKSFQLNIPFLSENTNLYLGLLNAPMFPLLFSSLSIYGVWVILSKESKDAKKKYWQLTYALVPQFLLFFLMIWKPFDTFMSSISI